MNVIVCVKQVLISTESLKLTGDGKIEEKGMSYDINEWDEYALEEAILIKEKYGGSVTAITIGPERSDKILRGCLAKGADKAIRFWEPFIAGADSKILARTLYEIIRELKYDLIMFGTQASDDSRAQLGPMVAQMLGIPHATMVTRLELINDMAKVRRELENGVEEIIEVDLPAVFAVQTGINRPRYAPLKGIMHAMKQTIPALSLHDIESAERSSHRFVSHLKLEKLYIPEADRNAHILEGTVAESTDKLITVLTDRGFL
jgi:electron transfer flavoprotein beta subunit